MSSPWLVAATLLSGFCIGLIPTLLDHAAAPLRLRLPLTERQYSRLLRTFYAAWLPGMPFFGWLLDHADLKEFLFFAQLGLMVGVAGLGLVQSLRGLFVDVGILGLAYSAVAVAAVRLMPVALRCDGSNIAALNLGFVPVGLGAMLGPLLLKRLTHTQGERRSWIVAGVALALPAALLAVSERLPDTPSVEHWHNVASDPRVLLIAVVIFLYFALENCLDVWPGQYLAEIGYQGRMRALALGAFWLAFLAMRLALGVLHPGAEVWLLLGLVLLSACALGNLAGAYGTNSGSVGFWLVGLCYGPLLPGFLALVFDFHLPGAALGFLLALSGLDTLVVRPVMVGYAKRQPARTVMTVPTVLAILLAAPLLVLALIQR